MGLTRDEKINIMVAHDIISIKADMEIEDYSIIYDVIVGDWDIKQYKDWSDEEVNSEFKDLFEDIKDRKDLFVDVLALAHKLNGEPINLLKA